MQAEVETQGPAVTDEPERPANDVSVPRSALPSTIQLLLDLQSKPGGAASAPQPSAARSVDPAAIIEPTLPEAISPSSQPQAPASLRDELRKAFLESVADSVPAARQPSNPTFDPSERPAVAQPDAPDRAGPRSEAPRSLPGPSILDFWLVRLIREHRTLVLWGAVALLVLVWGFTNYRSPSQRRRRESVAVAPPVKTRHRHRHRSHRPHHR